MLCNRNYLWGVLLVVQYVLLHASSSPVQPSVSSLCDIPSKYFPPPYESAPFFEPVRISNIRHVPPYIHIIITLFSLVSTMSWKQHPYITVLQTAFSTHIPQAEHHNTALLSQAFLIWISRFQHITVIWLHNSTIHQFNSF